MGTRVRTRGGCRKCRKLVHCVCSVLAFQVLSPLRRRMLSPSVLRIVNRCNTAGLHCKEAGGATTPELRYTNIDRFSKHQAKTTCASATDSAAGNRLLTARSCRSSPSAPCLERNRAPVITRVATSCRRRGWAAGTETCHQNKQSATNLIDVSGCSSGGQPHKYNKSSEKDMLLLVSNVKREEWTRRRLRGSLHRWQTLEPAV